MPGFYALVDAQAGREDEVEKGLASIAGVRHVRVKERAYDFLIRIDMDSFGVVDDFLQTYVRSLKGVMGVEVVTDWEDVGSAVRAARSKVD